MLLLLALQDAAATVPMVAPLWLVTVHEVVMPVPATVRVEVPPDVIRLGLAVMVTEGLVQPVGGGSEQLFVPA